MALRFYNYLTRKIEIFRPINRPNVTLYTCGPTVYDFVHIGNWRTFIFEDTLRRTLEVNGFHVKHVMNITDIDDKIIKAARDARLDVRKFVKPFEKAFFEDLKKLNIKKAGFYPKATENIAEMIQLVEKLFAKGFAYETSDGVYFDISNFPNYGRLSKLNKRSIKVGARIASDLYEKENPADFALWKFRKPGEPVWNSPWGEGRPGWHIECSAMAMQYLGENIDIHTGGVDLLFPHHENEIAQSEGATGAKFVNFWMEGEHLSLSGQKMAKSLGNIVTLKDLEVKGFDPLAFRYLCLTAHYRAKLNFTWESLEAAKNALNNLRIEVANWSPTHQSRYGDGAAKPAIGCAEFEKEFIQALEDDLDTPKALEVMWAVVKSDFPESSKHKSILYFNQVLGLGLDKVRPAKLPKGAKELIAAREELRATGEFKAADEIREKLKEMGVELQDTTSGPQWIIQPKE